ncbi:MAG TPA: outer membrane protein assembly factor BamD [Stellaceae bacterium]|nr:outer membrane protein assembly factor BamD [Stellaceae bacterium]
MTFSIRLAWPILASALLLAACAGTNKDAYVDRPVEALYNDAMNKMLDGGYSNAAKAFDEVDRQHPYSVWATRAELMSAYALYQANKYDESIVACDRFISLHPGHRDVAYAYYLKALDYYVQISDVERDQKTTQQALDALGEVVRRFPDSKYGRDARLKMDLARDHLAGKEMAIGRWYEQQGDYLAAINRFQRVIQKYQTTTHVPEALQRLTECYTALGLKDEAERVTAVLGYNYPGNAWYSDAYTLLKTDAPAEFAAATGGKPAETASAPPAATPEKKASAENSTGFFGRMFGAVNSIF